MAGAPQGGMNTTATNQNTSPATSTSTNPTVPTNNVFNQSAQGLNLAMAGTAQGMGYTPMGVQGVGYNPSQLASTNLSPYMNPYEQNVINNLQTDALRGQQMAFNDIGAQATAANAYGGSRHGVAEGVMGANIQRDLNNQIGQLRLGGFQNAQQMGLQDVGAQNQASQVLTNNIMNAQQLGPIFIPAF